MFFPTVSVCFLRFRAEKVYVAKVYALFSSPIRTNRGEQPDPGCAREVVRGGCARGCAREVVHWLCALIVRFHCALSLCASLCTLWG